MTTIRSADRRMLTLDGLKGLGVFNTHGDKIGKIEDVAFDLSVGTVVFAIVGSGGLLGLDEHHHAVPWGELHFDETRSAFVVAASDAEVSPFCSLEDAGLSGWGARQSAAFI